MSHQEAAKEPPLRPFNKTQERAARDFRNLPGSNWKEVIIHEKEVGLSKHTFLLSDI